jgi:very-short-patch-repair endonuclease
MQARLTQSRKQLIAERAREMRRSLTVSESALWQVIRGKRLGVTFRRQVPIGKFIADFVAPGAKLVVEVDGGYHATRAAADAHKDRFLRRAGYRVLRLPAALVMRNLGDAVGQVKQALESSKGLG